MVKTEKDYLLEQFYQFLEKLYGKKPEKKEDFEKLVAKKFGKNPNQDIDIEVTLGIKKSNGKFGARGKRSVGRIADFPPKPLPENTSEIVFYGEFVVRNESQEKLNFVNKKDRFAFQENIRIVKNIERKNFSERKPNVRYFKKEDLERISEIIKFEKHELEV